MTSSKIVPGEMVLTLPESQSTGESGLLRGCKVRKAYWDRPITKERQSKQIHLHSPIAMRLPSTGRIRPRLRPLKNASKSYERLSAVSKGVHVSPGKAALYTARRPHDPEKSMEVEACRDLYLSVDTGRYVTKLKEELRTSFAERLQGYLAAHQQLSPGREGLSTRRKKGKLRLHASPRKLPALKA